MEVGWGYKKYILFDVIEGCFIFILKMYMDVNKFL